MCIRDSLRRAYSVVAIICGTLLYYFFDGIRQNASALAEVVDKKGQSTTTVSYTHLTKRMAEDLTNYMAELGIRC